MPLPLTVGEIAGRVRGEVIGDSAVCVTGFAAAATAAPGDLTFADGPAYFAEAEASGASAILASGDSTSAAKVVIRVKNTRVAVARLLPLFFPTDAIPPGVDPTATIASSARIDPSAHIGPHCVIGEGVKIGARTALLGGNHVGRDCVLGEDGCLFPNVVLYARTLIGDRVAIHAGTVIGADGYGYVFDEGKQRKVLQAGNVVIHDDVEIGANAAIDRAALGSTLIGAGTKIDNLVHVAHNVVIGRHCLIMGQVGFAGSTQLGDYTVIASQSGIAGHLKLGKQSMVGAKSGVMRDIPDGGVVLGIPAVTASQAKRQWVATQQLPEMVKRMKKLERQVEMLTARIEERN